MKTPALVALCSLFLFPCCVLAQGGITTVRLEQVHFLINPSETNACDYVVFRDVSGEVVPENQMPTQIMNKVSNLCSLIVPRISIRDATARSFLGFSIDLPNMTPHGSIGLGTSILQGSGDPEEFPWIQVLSVSNVVVSADGLSRISYLELIDRLAQFLDLKTGILPSGGLIYGTAGNWATNYVPAYTMEMSVRYQE